MKTLLTMTLVLGLPALVLAAPPAPVQAPVQAPKAVQAPTQAPVQAPAVKTAQADQGYRTYSYQPAMNGNYNYNYARQGQPRNNVFRSAADKALGRIY